MVSQVVWVRVLMMQAILAAAYLPRTSLQCEVALSKGCGKLHMSGAGCRVRSLMVLRGGGRAEPLPQIPADAVGIMSSKGLQLRAVDWEGRNHGPDSAGAFEPTMSDGEGAGDAGGTEEEEQDKEESSISVTSDDDDVQGNEERRKHMDESGQWEEVPPAQLKLWMACQSGNDASIYELVRAEGADVNAHDPNFGLWTACHYAARAGRSRIIESLWRLGADIDAINAVGSAPLNIAAAEGHVSLVQKLVGITSYHFST